MKHKIAILLISLSILAISCSKEEADLIVHNAHIYQVDPTFSTAEAMAIRGDSILAIGAEHEILNKYSSDNMVDAGTKFIFPGFIDAHCHFFGYGMSLQQVNLTGTHSFEEVLETLSLQKDKQIGGWITGRGWDQNDWTVKSFPNKSAIDSLFPETPVFLKRIDGHAALVNQAALNLAGITIETEVNGGIIEQKDGQLTGILIDNAVDLVNNIVPKADKAIQQKALLDAQKNCFSKGLTTVDDAGLDKSVIDLIDELHKNNELKIKVYAMANPTEENMQHFFGTGPYTTDRLSVRSFKIYADGALGSRGARLIAPYSDMDHHHAGLLIHSPEYFRNLAQELYQHGFQMNTHAIGDSANRLLLHVYSEILNGVNDRRWRIEHAQVIDESDFALFSANTIIPSVQPTHATSDMYWAEDRLGVERIKNAYAYNKLLSQNGLIILGTDFPVEDISPVKTFYAAVTRKDSSGYPDGGFQAGNALNRENALKGMTIWAAIGNFEETDKGSLETGKKADFVILDRDILRVAENQLLSTKVISTYINGERVYHHR